VVTGSVCDTGVEWPGCQYSSSSAFGDRITFGTIGTANLLTPPISKQLLVTQPLDTIMPTNKVGAGAIGVDGGKSRGVGQSGIGGETVLFVVECHLHAEGCGRSGSVIRIHVSSIEFRVDLYVCVPRW